MRHHRIITDRSFRSFAYFIATLSTCRLVHRQVACRELVLGQDIMNTRCVSFLTNSPNSRIENMNHAEHYVPLSAESNFSYQLANIFVFKTKITVLYSLHLPFTQKLPIMERFSTEYEIAISIHHLVEV